MNPSKNVLFRTLIFTVVIVFSSHGFAFDLSNPLFHSGITDSGISGLLISRGGTSIGPGKYFLGLTPEYFDRDLAGGAKEKKLTFPLTFTWGLPNEYHMEVAARLPFATVDNGSSDSGFTELDLLFKWSFLQQEGKPFPSLAVGTSVTFGIADQNKGLTDVNDYGLTLFLSGTALIDLNPGRDYAFSVLGDGEIVLNDWGNNDEEKHGAYSLGVLLPLPSYSMYGFLLEFDGTVNRGRDRGDDFIRITPAFRANYDRWSFSIGIGFVNPERSGEDSFVNLFLQAIRGF